MTDATPEDQADAAAWEAWPSSHDYAERDAYRAGFLAALSSQPGEVERLREERVFLLARCDHAGSFRFSDEGRWIGVSSNALVSIAFGQLGHAYPSDSADLAACYRMLTRLPRHLHSDAVYAHLEHGERHVEGKYPGAMAEAALAARWPGRAALHPTKEEG